ncbi:hypothetical protein [Laspinema olomoucense]|nr:MULTISPECIES: hypothetical protein [unclassified Laspinema]
MNNCNVEDTPAIAQVQLNPIKWRSVPSPGSTSRLQSFPNM